MPDASARLLPRLAAIVPADVTNGGVNPVLTIYANAFRIADHMVRGTTG